MNAVLPSRPLSVRRATLLVALISLFVAPAHGASVLRFADPDDVVDTGSPVQLSGAFTVAAWCRADRRSSGTGFGHIAGQGNNMAAAAGGFGIYTDGDWPVMQVNHGHSAVEWTFDGAASETWHLVVARFDENASPDPICDLWVDGTWKNYWQRDNSSGKPWDIPEGWATSAEPFLMGRSIGSNGATNAFRGCIAEVSVWNRMLTTAEIQTMAAHRLRGDEPGLVGYWPMDEGSGAVVRNAAFGPDAAASDGAISGATWEWAGELDLPTYEEWAGTSIRSETTRWSVSFATNGCTTAFVREPGAAAPFEVPLDANGEGTLCGLRADTLYEAWAEDAGGAATPVERFRTPADAADLPAWTLSLDGVDDVVSMGAGFSVTNDFTLACWYRRDFVNAASGYYQIMAGQGSFKQANGQAMTGYALYTEANNLVTQVRQVGVSDAMWASTGEYGLPRGEWRFGTIRFDIASHRLDLFVNGVHESWVERGSGWNSSFASPWRSDDVPCPFALGARYDPSASAIDKFFQGAVAEVSLWNRALSNAEIAALATTRVVGDEEDLVGYWPVTDGPHGAGTAVLDFLAGGRAAHDGVATGGPTWSRDASFGLAPPEAVHPGASAADAVFDRTTLRATVSSELPGDWDVWAVWDAADRGTGAALDWASGPVACGSIAGASGAAAVADVPDDARVLRFALVRSGETDSVRWTDPIDLTLVERTGYDAPVASLSALSTGASHAQFRFALSSLGTGADSATATLTLSPATPGGAIERTFAAAPATFEISVPGLDPATAYEWTLALVNSRNETDSLSGSFTTSSAPSETAAPIVSATSFAVDAAGVATVGYDVSWPGSGAATADLLLVWGLAPGPFDRTNALASVVIGDGLASAALTGLVPSRTYAARLVARNPATGATAVAPEALSFSTAADFGRGGAGGTARAVSIVAANLGASGTEESFDLAFGVPPVHRAYTLLRASGPCDAGTDPAAWPVLDTIATVAPAEFGRAAVPVPAGWGDTAHAVRFFLVADDAEAPFDARVSYLDSNGTTYVDTGIVVDRHTAFSFRFAWLTSGRAWGRAFGSYVDENNNATRVIMNNNNVTVANFNFLSRAGSSQSSDYLNVSIGTAISGTLDYDKVVLNGKTNTVNHTAGTANSAPILLFGGATGGNSVRFWEFDATTNGLPSFHLVPVSKDGAGRVYDALTGRLLPTTSGALAAGPALATTGFEACASWSETALRTDPDVPRFAPGLSCTPTGVFDTGIVEGALETAGAGGCTLTAELSPTADFAAFAAMPAGAASAAGPYSIRLHLLGTTDANRLLELGETGFIRLRATAGNGRTALSDAVSFAVPLQRAPGTVVIVR